MTAENFVKSKYPDAKFNAEEWCSMDSYGVSFYISEDEAGVFEISKNFETEQEAWESAKQTIINAEKQKQCY